VRILVTGGSGVLGRAAMPLLRAEGHVVSAPSRAELDLFDPGAVAEAVAGMDAVLHLATGIPPSGVRDDREVWRENDRLRREASALLVDAALATAVRVYIQPSVTFVYPSFGPVDESTPLADVPEILRSALDGGGGGAFRRRRTGWSGAAPRPPRWTGDRPRFARPSLRSDPRRRGRGARARGCALRAERDLQRLPRWRTRLERAVPASQRVGSAALSRRWKHERSPVWHAAPS
jgi:uncharacterized protein YbjT (DUF2867 family)